MGWIMNAYQTKILNDNSKLTWGYFKRQSLTILGTASVAATYYGVYANILPQWAESVASMLMVLYFIAHAFFIIVGLIAMFACKIMLTVGDEINITTDSALGEKTHKIPGRREFFRKLMGGGILRVGANRHILAAIDMITDTVLFSVLIYCNHPFMAAMFFLSVVPVNLIYMKIRKYTLAYISQMTDPLDGADEENIDDLSDKLFNGGNDVKN
jgi:hypothetical protein